MAYITIRAVEVFPGSFDTLAMLIGDERDFVFAFNGFMDSIDDFSSLKPEEIIIYKGRKAREVFDYQNNPESVVEDENRRNIDLTDDIKKRIVDWILNCEELVIM